MLITNSKESLYGGVNQQSAEHRLETQVEECINATPTVNQGLVKRNPTEILTSSTEVDYTKNMFSYEYDRGLAGKSSEKYSIQLSTDSKLNIIDVTNGDVFNVGNGGVEYQDDADKYLFPFAGVNGYSAVTVKDTTFIVNKNASPSMRDRIYSNEGSETTETQYTATLSFSKSPTTKLGFAQGDLNPSEFAPYSFQEYSDYDDVLTSYNAKGALTEFTIDGRAISLKLNYSTENDVSLEFMRRGLETFDDYIQLLVDRMADSGISLPNYDVTTDGGDIVITKLDGTQIAVGDVSITIEEFPTYSIYAGIVAYNPDESDYFDGTTLGTTSDTIQIQNANYDKDGFIWIKGSNPTSPYTYSFSLVNEDPLKSYSASIVTDGTTYAHTTEGAAEAIAADINANTTHFTAAYDGSIVKVTSAIDNIVRVDVTDSYGNQASFGWAKEVSNSNDLPKNIVYPAIVHVNGEFNSGFKGYWLEYKSGWKETVSPSALTELDPSRMPHIIERRYRDIDGSKYFVVRQYDKWATRRVGDDDTNKIPSFALSNPDDENKNLKIKDIFFFKNRLGFITENTVVMSEVGEYGNFFRTTVSAVLDSDRIDTSVDTTKAIQLEYATYLEDSLMLFSDKAQFKLEGGKILSPSSVQISQTSAYEINTSVRPLFMNDKVFFVATRGDYSAVMQYFIAGDGRISEAIDLTSHCEYYIPNDITSISGSPVNNMVFLTSGGTDDTIFVYKYLDSGSDRVQSAWFKWVYDATIYKAFSLGKNLNLLTKRKRGNVEEFIYPANDLYPADDLYPVDIIYSLETQAIHPIDYTGYFVDTPLLQEDKNDVVRFGIVSNYAVATYYATGTQLTYDVIISLVDENLTEYEIEALTTSGDAYMSVNSPLTVPRNPSNALTNIKITIINSSGNIFNGITIESSVNLGTDISVNGGFTNSSMFWERSGGFYDIYNKIETGYNIESKVELGEWVPKSGDKAMTDGKTKMKTCQINSEDGSNFYLTVEDVVRGTTRNIESKYTVDRKPMIYGDSKNIRLSINSNSNKGFRINSVVLEGNYNTRNRRL